MEETLVPSVPLKTTTLGSVVTLFATHVFGYRTVPVELSTHAETTSAPLMIGFAPLPYAANVIGLPTVPLCPGCNVSRHNPPRLNPTDCPGVRVVELTFAIVFQGSACVPGLESEPLTEST